MTTADAIKYFEDRKARSPMRGFVTACDIAIASMKSQRHAHWEIRETTYAKFARCSACGIHIRIPTTGKKESERFYLYPDEMHFCTNCGAKMDGNEDSN